MNLRALSCYCHLLNMDLLHEVRSKLNAKENTSLGMCNKDWEDDINVT